LKATLFDAVVANLRAPGMAALFGDGDTAVV